MKCPICNIGELKRETRKADFTYSGSTIYLDQTADWCQSCGEGILTVDDMESTREAREFHIFGKQGTQR